MALRNCTFDWSADSFPSPRARPGKRPGGVATRRPSPRPSSLPALESVCGFPFVFMLISPAISCPAERFRIPGESGAR
ncbi:unnamed protein product, partial [Iphiclides podalirius]